VVRVPGYRSRGQGSIPGATRFSEKLALTSPTSSGPSIGIVRSRTQDTEFSLVLDHHQAIYSLYFLFVCRFKRRRVVLDYYIVYSVVLCVFRGSRVVTDCIIFGGKWVKV
jgi:hypothetical protein